MSLMNLVTGVIAEKPLGTELFFGQNEAKGMPRAVITLVAKGVKRTWTEWSLSKSGFPANMS
jgi:hypothetical protein